MDTSQLLEELDREIERLREVRSLLVGDSGGWASSGRKSGRPAQQKAPVKRVWSAEARAKIAAAQKKRWARQKAGAKAAAAK